MCWSVSHKDATNACSKQLQNTQHSDMHPELVARTHVAPMWTKNMKLLLIKDNIQHANDMDNNTIHIIYSDHSFLQNVKFWAKQWNLPISAEFQSFHGILQNLLLASDFSWYVRKNLVGSKFCEFLPLIFLRRKS